MPESGEQSQPGVGAHTQLHGRGEGGPIVDVHPQRGDGKGDLAGARMQVRLSRARPKCGAKPSYAAV